MDMRKKARIEMTNLGRHLDIEVGHDGSANVLVRRRL
jgi:hypothetical protein